MSPESVQILVENQNFMEPPSKRKKMYGREAETGIEKGNKFQWTEEMVEYFRDSLTIYKVICKLSEKNLMPTKLFSTVNCEKKWRKVMKVFVYVKLLLTLELIYRFRRGTDLRGK